MNNKAVLIYIFVFIFFQNIKAQDLINNLANAKLFTLTNKISLIYIETDTPPDRFKMGLFIDIKPNNFSKLKWQILADLKFLQFNNFIFSKIIQIDTNAIDSSFKFFKFLITDTNYTQYQIDRLIKKYQSYDKQEFLIDYLSSRNCMGKKNPYIRNSPLDSIADLKKYQLSQLQKSFFQNAKITIIFFGKTNQDSLFKLFKKNFSKIETQDYSFKYRPKNFVKNNDFDFFNVEGYKKIKLRICLPLSPPQKADNFLNRLIFKYLLEQNFKNYKKRFSTFSYSSNLKFLDDWSQNAILFDFEVKKYSLFQQYELFRQFASSYDTIKIAEIKKYLNTTFDFIKKDTSEIINWAFKIKKYDLGFDFLLKAEKKILKLNKRKIKIPKPQIILDSSKTQIFAEEKNVRCQLYYLAYYGNVNFYDTKFNKYAKIPKGFNSHTVINDYLTAVNASKQVRNLIIFFDAYYNFDTLYRLEGTILKKYPYYYRYKTRLILGKDTIFHNLQIANGKEWFDSTALGKKFYTREEFFARIYKAYIFPELFYDSLGYTTSLICDTELVNQNVFIVKVNTNSSVSYYDYYDLNQKRKIRTDVKIKIGDKEYTKEIIEYNDYKKIGKNSEIIMPFTIREIIGSNVIVLKIKKIQTNKRIPTYYFKIY